MLFAFLVVFAAWLAFTICRFVVFGGELPPSWLSLWSAILQGVMAVTGCVLLFVSWPEMMAKKQRLGSICPQCGYDLRATPDRCPECGTAVERPKP
jgi:hypothetical protein